jgi:polysaccharide deacetylase 2 family uncharacterized protein YibQ
MARKKSGFPIKLLLVVVAVLAVVAFGIGEAIEAARSDRTRLLLARHLRIGEPAQVTRLVGRQIERGLEAVGVPRDSIRESFPEDGPTRLRWRVGLAPDASLLQANAAIHQAVTEAGAVVLSGRESRSAEGEARVTLLAGLPGRATHEVVLARSPRPEREQAPPGARLSLVVYGFGDDMEAARAWLALEEPFAVAIVPGTREATSLLKAARDAHRPIVLHLPLEPINYPQVDPGPGAILVTMEPRRIVTTMRRWFDQASGAVAAANHMGSLATQDEQVMGAIYQELARRRVPFIHVERVPGAVAQSMAARHGVAYDRPDAVIDAEARATDTKGLDRRWKDVLDQARDRREVMVWLRATDTARRWLPGALAAKKRPGVELVPLTSVLRRPGRP